MNLPARVTAVTLLGIAGIHVVWARGSSFPFRTLEEMHDAVIGQQVHPSPAACYGVVGLLVTAAAAVAGLPTKRSRVRRVVVAGTAATLGSRAVFGFAGRSDRLVSGSTSPRFRNLDRRVYSPLCAALAAGAGMSLLT